MKKLTEWLTQHAIAINVVSTTLLIANALLIILNPRLLLHILRYTFAVMCASLAGWNIVSLNRKV